MSKAVKLSDQVIDHVGEILDIPSDGIEKELVKLSKSLDGDFLIHRLQLPESRDGLMCLLVPKSLFFVQVTGWPPEDIALAIAVLLAASRLEYEDSLIVNIIHLACNRIKTLSPDERKVCSVLMEEAGTRIYSQTVPVARLENKLSDPQMDVEKIISGLIQRDILKGDQDGVCFTV